MYLRLRTIYRNMICNNLIIKTLWFLKKNLKLSRPKLNIPLEIQIADHCNLNCIGCSHYSPISNENFINLEKLQFSIARLSLFKKFLRVIRILGGEPLLNPSLVSLIKMTRKYLNSTPIEIVTNGILLLNDNVCSEIFWDTIAENNVKLCITLYPISLDIKRIEEKCREKGIFFKIYANRNSDNGFKKFLLDNKKKGNILNFYRCFESECFQLVDGKIFTCPQSAYSYKLNNKFGTNFNIVNKDYLDLHNISLGKFIKFINSPKPFCKYCVFPRQTIKWSKSKEEISEWVKQI